jgi:hypothetical protein
VQAQAHKIHSADPATQRLQLRFCGIAVIIPPRLKLLVRVRERRTR